MKVSSILFLLLIVATLTSCNPAIQALISATPAVIKALTSAAKSLKSTFMDTSHKFNAQQAIRTEDFDFPEAPNGQWQYLTTTTWNHERMPEKLENMNKKIIELNSHEEDQAQMLDTWRKEQQQFFANMETYLHQAPSIFLQQSIDEVIKKIKDNTSRMGMTVDMIISDKINNADSSFLPKCTEEIDKKLRDSTSKLGLTLDNIIAEKINDAKSAEVQSSIKNIESQISKEISSWVSDRVDLSLQDKMGDMENEVFKLLNAVSKMKEDLEAVEDNLGLNRIVGGTITVIGLICAVISKLLRPPSGPQAGIA